MRSLLVLARVSNLPTVWSNCLAAWLLTGGSSWGRFGLVCLGATFLYTGGMFLNDAVDQDFDRRYRPERPIVSGQISSRAVWALSFLWLALGLGTFLALGGVPALLAVLLLAAIVIYDLVHKHTILAPLIMASCRFLLYLVAGAAAANRFDPGLIRPAAALAAYIVGLSYLARGESTGARLMVWSGALLFVPALLAIFKSPPVTWTLWVAVVIQLVWTLWCGFLPNLKSRFPLPRGVAGLLAGIALVDWVAVAPAGPAVAFIALFFLALLSQRVAPAT